MQQESPFNSQWAFGITIMIKKSWKQPIILKKRKTGQTRKLLLKRRNKVRMLVEQKPCIYSQKKGFWPSLKDSKNSRRLKTLLKIVVHVQVWRVYVKTFW